MFVDCVVIAGFNVLCLWLWLVFMSGVCKVYGCG